MRQASKSKMAFTCLKQKNQNVTALSDFACSTIGPHHFIVNLWFPWNVLDISQLSWHPFSGLLYQSVFYAGPDVLNKMQKKDLSSKILCSPFSGQFLSQKHGALPWSHLAATYHSDTRFFNKEISFFTWSLPCFFLCSCCYTKQCSRNSNFDWDERLVLRKGSANYCWFPAGFLSAQTITYLIAVLDI